MMLAWISRLAPAAMLAIALAGCGFVKPLAPVVPGVEPDVQRVWLISGRGAQPFAATLGAPRPTGLRYGWMDVTIPPGHVRGQFEYRRGRDDPARVFTLPRMGTYRSRAAFDAALPGPRRILFVHGFNYFTDEAVARAAQIASDFEIVEPMLAFAWPSASDPRGYAYDRDSVLYARDDLVETLRQLTDARGEGVFVMAHSMGAQLAMEAMRQLAIEGDRQTLAGIDGVALISPDLDTDVFRRQAERIGALPQPFLIMIQRGDPALGLSSFLSGRKPRLGVIDGPEAVAGLDVTVLDFTDVAPRNAPHIAPVSDPRAISFLRRLGDDMARGVRVLPQLLQVDPY